MFDVNSLHENVCLLVEDQVEIQRFLEECVGLAFPGLKIINASSIAEARSILESFFTREIRPHLLFSLIDLGLPDGSGIEIIQWLSEHQPSTLNVVVTIFNEDAYLFDAISAGAFGYLLKNEEKEYLVDALRRLIRNEPPISPSVARRLLAHFRKPNHLAGEKVLLTPREKQTLTLLVRGLTVPESAAEMGLSAQTVSGYVKTIYQKLHVSNRAEATREAIRRGYV